ncbi:MAG: hypothetical protein J6M12_08905 [Clostridia bacterium]|nr:hypothetical protein [Clostridia bacterium]
MYEQLLYPQKHPVKNIIFAIGLILLPFAFFEFSLQNGKFVFDWTFDLIDFAASVCLSVTWFLPTSRNFHYQNIPFIAVLVMEFLRFGSVSLLGNEIPFESYIASAFFMLGALGSAFVMYFVAEGKMRSRAPLIFWSVLMMVIAPVSLIVGVPPFGAYTEIVEGTLVRNLSGCIQFVLFYSVPLLLAIALKSDHFPKKQKRKNRKKEE